MARKSSSRRSRKNKRGMNKRKTYRRVRGGNRLMGAPVGYSLAGDYSSKMSMGQGGDYMKYHQGQHGGQAPLSAITGSGLDSALRGAAHLGGLDKAFNDIKGLRDQAGGRHKRSHKRSHKRKGKKSQQGGKHRKSHRKRKSHHKRKSHRKSHRKQGGALGFAPFGGDAMLLKSPMQYAQAGLSPEWKTNVEFGAASNRAAL